MSALVSALPLPWISSPFSFPIGFAPGNPAGSGATLLLEFEVGRQMTLADVAGVTAAGHLSALRDPGACSLQCRPRRDRKQFLQSMLTSLVPFLSFRGLVRSGRASSSHRPLLHVWRGGGDWQVGGAVDRWLSGWDTFQRTV